MDQARLLFFSPLIIFLLLVNHQPQPYLICTILSYWLKQLEKCLLHSEKWEPADIDAWSSVVDDIQQNWCKKTNQTAFPKLHMLRHTVEFAERHRFLGRVSEAQIESFHAQFNAVFHKQHRNMSAKIAERLRRCLADVALRTVQPHITKQ